MCVLPVVTLGDLDRGMVLVYMVITVAVVIQFVPTATLTKTNKSNVNRNYNQHSIQPNQK